MSEDVYDLVGVGVGPFNLGLAALLDDVEADCDAAFLEQRAAFDWHEDMLIEGTTLEVPFLADLVTMVDPTSPYSYLNYLRAENRLYEFYFYEEFFLPRREYNAYCRWVAEQLPSLRFRRRVTSIDVEDDGDAYRLTAIDPETGERETYLTENVVVGIGTRPRVPDRFADVRGDDVFHTASYLGNRERCLNAERITVVGSGQSAAEVVRDLLERQPEHGYALDWLTRSRGFFQMADAKLGHMIYTPDYTDYFYDLDQATKDELREGQTLLYKGIDERTSAAIYDLLYEGSIGAAEPDVGMLAATEVREIGPAPDGDGYALLCEQWQESERFVQESDVVVLGTGYERVEPPFAAGLADRLERDDAGRLDVTRDFRLSGDDLPGEIYVQNAEIHTHGINAPDLGLGPYRNAVILDGLLAASPYGTELADVFQSFSVDDYLARRESARRVAAPPNPDD
ncbi:lysine N(6)-hydroxylase/L-ornithine N(5)-oxygenase family protein [Halarchaeum nitratireducens]|uniref:Lysine 6-monooxygenase n=1 Tax=Halarchaeum nitratireducens TaxID=489913 RepID=A0A830G957_9EURY|nr:SidA/IucD/PvdA family monooxygenase [Halarchaeum nitratireducens]GGN09883.1 lysine 6-monooxygenase [Halarchaeum nitratireducens]